MKKIGTSLSQEEKELIIKDYKSWSGKHPAEDNNLDTYLIEEEFTFPTSITSSSDKFVEACLWLKQMQNKTFNITDALDEYHELYDSLDL